jgi:hypothetical protein
MDWLDEIITLYLFICDAYKSELCSYCERYSNYSDLSFGDEEVLVIYMYGIMDGRKNIRQIHQHAKNYWLDLFPNLPSYVAFVQRINKMHDVFISLITKLQTYLPTSFSSEALRLLDSMPIIMAQQGRRFTAKVAPDLADKSGYCATKNMYYYGVKIHVVGSYHKGSIPVPEFIGLTAAGVSDRKAYEQVAPALGHVELFADKAYQKGGKPLFTEYATNVYTPVKKKKGQEFLDAADQLLSTAISRVRQPIESFFNWLEQKTGIQMASKVRSSNGLLVHVFGRIATALYMLVGKLSS